MNERKRIPDATRAALLDKARFRCCLHRLAWVELLADDPSALKWRPLELHHVVFHSRGGTDDLDNLIPICPLCHTIIHSTRTLGRVAVSDDTLRQLWELWQSFDGAVPSSVHIGQGEVAASVTVSLNAYGLRRTFSVDSETPYYKARQKILTDTVGVLASADPHFPFPRGLVRPEDWLTSADAIAGAGLWDRRSAAEVFQALREPLRLEAPLIIALDSRPNPFLSGTTEQRTT